MTYNIHPIFVHFPIALLCLYSIIKIIPFGKLLPKVSWKHIERTLLIVGALGAFASSATGEMAEYLVKVNRQILNAHSLFADISIGLYGALLFGELLVFVTPLIAQYQKLNSINKILKLIQKILTGKFVSITLSILGLIALSMTGLLGGILVYGTTADPFAGTILQLLGISY
jgi:uncharacterized membrane protein